MQTYRLSWPPSTNDLWRAYRGRNILSRKARLWADQAAKELVVQGIKAFKGPVNVWIELKSPHKRRFDPDNRIKAVLDLLVKNNVLEGDTDAIIHTLTVHTQNVVSDGVTVSISSVVPAS